METGWHLDTQDGYSYYLDDLGRMQLGWTQVGGKWYYFNPIANIETWALERGKWYYMGVKSRPLGSMYKSTTTPDGYKVDENGCWVK